MVEWVKQALNYKVVVKPMIDAAEDHRQMLMKLKYPSHIPNLHKRTYLQKYLCLYEREIAPKETWWLLMDIAPTYLNHLTLDVS